MTVTFLFLIVLLLSFIGLCYYIHTKRKGKQLVDQYRPYLLYGRILRK